jgi:23S rRNA (guanosine2251-2'-O)-methyltransferase
MSNPKRHSKPAGKSGRSYWLYGLHAVRAALGNSNRDIRRVLAAPGGQEKIAGACEAYGVSAEAASMQEISRLLPVDAVHQGVAAEVMPLPERSLEEYLAHPRGERAPLVLLDQVTDPHNIGAILRSAAAFGAGAVVVTRDNAPQESAVLAKASSGGIEIVPYIVVTNLAQCMETLKKHGYWCIGLDAEAPQTLAQAKLGRPLALVLGAEGKGLRRLSAERCDLLVRLPIQPEMESLNVSNAAAVALYAMTL